MEPQRQSWKADPHQWGEGKIHAIHEDGTRTLCGRALTAVPGKRVATAEYNCQACAQAIAIRERNEKNERAWKERQLQFDLGRMEREQRQEAENQKWWNWFREYLRSPEWSRRRRLVLERARGICEACGQRQATEVHHLTYDHVGNEPLFDLAAICHACHEALTEDDRRRRAIAAARGIPRRF